MPPGPIRNRAERRRPGELRLPGSNRVLTWSSGGAPAHRDPRPAGTRVQPVREGAAPGPAALREPPHPAGTVPGRRPAQRERDYGRESDTGTAPLTTAGL